MARLTVEIEGDGADAIGALDDVTAAAMRLTGHVEGLSPVEDAGARTIEEYARANAEAAADEATRDACGGRWGCDYLRRVGDPSAYDCERCPLPAADPGPRGRALVTLYQRVQRHDDPERAVALRRLEAQLGDEIGEVLDAFADIRDTVVELVSRREVGDGAANG